MGGEPSRSRRGKNDVESAVRQIGGGDGTGGTAVGRLFVFVWGVVWGFFVMSWLWPTIRRLGALPRSVVSRGYSLLRPQYNSRALDSRATSPSRINIVEETVSNGDPNTPAAEPAQRQETHVHTNSPAAHPVPVPALPTDTAKRHHVTWPQQLDSDREQSALPRPVPVYAEVEDEVWLCSLPGCSRPCYVETSGRVHDYCGRTHALQHKQTLEGPPAFAPMVNTGNGPILFYNRDEPYYEFTNFYRAKVKLDGKWWPTTEHYFQAQKFIGTPYVEQIRKLEAPRMAFSLSRNPQVARWRRRDWEEEKVNVMYKALLAKFTQNERLRTLLLGTGRQELIEHSPYDRYWGDGGDGTGENMLGRLLMKLRGELQGETMEMPRPSYQQSSSYTGGSGFSGPPPTGTPRLVVGPPAVLPTHTVVTSLEAPLIASDIPNTEGEVELGVSGQPSTIQVTGGTTVIPENDIGVGTGADQEIVRPLKGKNSPESGPGSEDPAQVAISTSEGGETAPDGVTGIVPRHQEDKSSANQDDQSGSESTSMLSPGTITVPALETQSQLQTEEKQEEEEEEEEEEDKEEEEEEDKEEDGEGEKGEEEKKQEEKQEEKEEEGEEEEGVEKREEEREEDEREKDEREEDKKESENDPRYKGKPIEHPPLGSVLPGNRT